MRLVPVPCLALGLAIACVLAPLPAAALTFHVTKTADTADGACDSDCSLREAVIAANATPGADIIRLAHAFYRLTQPAADEPEDQAHLGDLDISDDLVIRGLVDRSVIDANALDRVIEVLPEAKVELIDLVLRNGNASSRGGGVYNWGDLTLRRTWVTRNRVRLLHTDILHGGGIFNQGQLRLVFAKVYLNTALDGLTGGLGGGLFNAPGAAIYMYDTDVRDNVTGLDDARGHGAGLYNRGAARIDRSFFFRNDPGDGEGSAMANRSGGTLSVFNTTVSGNGHDGALGAIANGSPEPITPGELTSKLNLFNVTIADNNGGGLYNAGRAWLRNTLIAGNYTQDGHDRWYDVGRNCVNDGEISHNGHVLMGADGNCPGTILVDNATVFQVVLEHLRYLGGPTPIHPQRPGPYTIDMGHPTECPDRDQRFGRRPADGDLNGSEICDIGAAEANADE